MKLTKNWVNYWTKQKQLLMFLIFLTKKKYIKQEQQHFWVKKKIFFAKLVNWFYSWIFIGGVLQKLSDDENNQWIFTFLNIGDCKVFHYNAQLNVTVDLTDGYRTNARDSRDPLGRLGPAVEGGSPDLRNFQIGSVVINEGDFIIACTDGLHDNLDP